MKANRWEAAALACAGLLVSETASAQCSGWQSGFANGPDSDVDVMEVFDDGRGPALYVAAGSLRWPGSRRTASRAGTARAGRRSAAD